MAYINTHSRKFLETEIRKLYRKHKGEIKKIKNKNKIKERKRSMDTMKKRRRKAGKCELVSKME